MILGVEFPPISHLVNWPNFLLEDNTYLGINKVVLVYFMAAALSIGVIMLGNRKQLVPTGMQNLAEQAVEFVEDGIVLQTIGPHGLKWTPYLLSTFLFIFFCNIFEIIPVIQMPANARIALPMLLSLLAYVMYHGAGFVEHGPLGYLKHALIAPGIPFFLHFLVVPIELVSKFLVQPFSHAVRLFANLLAGHILLVTFAILTAALWSTNWTAVFLPLPLFAVIFFVIFEILVSVLQAYVFTLLAGVYIGAAVSHEH